MIKKNNFCFFFFKLASILKNIKIKALIINVKRILSLKLTAHPIPIVISAKNKTSSRGLFTGFRNLTIDNAPIIPSDKAKLPDIKTVIIMVTEGRRQ